MFVFKNRHVCYGGMMMMMTGVTTCMITKRLDAQGNKYPLTRRKFNEKKLNVYFVRHAESQNNALHKTVKNKAEYMRLRSSDPKLSKIGEKQAEALKFKMAREVQNGSKVSMWVSPLHRTLLTAQPTAKALNIKPIVDTELFELYGCFQQVNGLQVPFPGKTREEISIEFPYYDTRSVRADGWYATKDFETHEECVVRASRLVRRLRKEVRRLQTTEDDTHDEHNIIIVSHGNFLSEVLKSILGTSNDVGYSCGNASVTKLTLMCDEFGDTALSVGYIFAVDHLESDSLITGTNLKGLYHNNTTSS